MKELEGLPKSYIKWFHKRPKIIQEAIIKRRPDKLYKIKKTGEQCYIISYSEPISAKCDNDESIKEVTLRVKKTGAAILPDSGLFVDAEIRKLYNPFAEFGVFGLKLDDLEEWKDPQNSFQENKSAK